MLGPQEVGFFLACLVLPLVGIMLFDAFEAWREDGFEIFERGFWP